jgi:electron transfer flavoprotein alpha subunit
MNPRLSFSKLAIAAVAALLLGACANQMEPARQAIAGIDTAVSAASADAAKYIPEQYAAAQGKLAELKGAFDRKDYKAVLAGAPALLTEAQGLAAAAATKKDEVMKSLAADWSSMSTTLPALVSAVESRVTVLGKSRKLPEGVDLESAKRLLAEAKGMWSQAQAASGNNVEDAVATAKTVKERAEAAAAALKLQLPGAATPAA